MINTRNIVIPVSILIIIFAASCDRQDAKTSVEMAVGVDPVNNEFAQTPLPHPLSIEGLRVHNFSAGSIKLLNQVDAADGLEAWDFSYNSEGLELFGLIEKPAGEAPPGGWPVIVLAHGYILPSSYSTPDNYRLVTRYYAAGGFLVVKPDYRGHGRSGGAGGGPTRTIDYSIDVLNIIAGLDGIPDADSDNVFLYGHSMGGEIGLRILTVNKSLRGASLWAAVTERFPENTLFFIRRRSAEEAARLQEQIDAQFTPAEYASLTPTNYLESIDVPILVHHGTEDESVPFEWSLPFRERLDTAGVDYRFYEYPGENHNISKSFYKVMDKDMAFFRSLME
jgi:dipeptidyl aminopeptidase/acylaminoacyl peptidase